MVAGTGKDGNSTLRIQSVLKKIVYRLRGEYTVESLIAMGLKVGRNFNPQLGVELDPSHCWLIEIGDDVTIAPHVQILAHDASTCLGTGYARIGRVRIGDRVFVGAGSVVLPGVTIGNDVIVGAGSVVSKSVPDGSVYAGNPAKFVCTTQEFNEKHLERQETFSVFDASFTLREQVSMEKRIEQKEALEKCGGEVCQVKLTVFTPTYNRAALLHRVYESLCSQTSIEFEWLIVDDGSSDETSKVVNKFLEEKKIAIRYVKQKNGGKHTAFNTAADLACGEYFLCLDSDDWLADHAVEKIISGLEHIEDGDCGLVGYKQLPDGSLLSGNLPTGHKGLYAYGSQYGVSGEFSLVFRTDLIKKYHYPITPGEKFVGECVLYDRLELDGYTLCPLPEVIEVCEYQQDGLTSNLYQIMLNNPMGYQLYHAQRIDLVNTIKARYLHAIRYHAFRLMSEKKYGMYCGNHKLIVLGAALPGRLAKAYYYSKRKK